MKKIKALVALALASTITFSSSINVFADVDAYVAYDEMNNEYYQYNADELIKSYRNHKRYGENDGLYLDFLDKLKHNKNDLLHDDSGKYVSYEEAVKEFNAKNGIFDVDKFSDEAEVVETPEYVYDRIVKENKVVDGLNLTRDGIEKDLSRKEQFKEYEDLRITGDNVTITNGDIKGILTLDPGEGGSAFVKNVKANKMMVLSGGVNSIHLFSTEIGTLEVNSDDDKTRIECKQVKFGKTIIRTYTIIDKENGKMGTITVSFEEGSKNPVVEFSGKITEDIIVESSATLRTAQNAELSRVIVNTKNKNSEVNLHGNYGQVQVKNEAKVNIMENSIITEGMLIQAQSQINAKGNAFISKLQIAPEDSKAHIRLSGKFKTVQIDRKSNVSLENGKVTKMVLNNDVNLNVNNGANISEVYQNGHRANLSDGTKNKIGEIDPKPSNPSQGSKKKDDGDDDDDEREKKVIIENIADIDIKVNEVETIKVKANTGAKISASADKTDVVQVTVDGTNLKVKGLKEGEANIIVTASKNGYKSDSETFKVIVKAVPVTGITLKEASKDLVVGNTYQVKAEIQPSNATNKEIIWSTSDDKIAEVDENGLVTAVAKGEADITAETEDGNYKAVCKITVREQEIIPEIILNSNNVCIKIDSVKVGSSTVTIKILNRDNGNLEFMHEKIAENGVIEFTTNLKNGSYYAEINVVGVEKVVSEIFTVTQ